MSEEPTLTVREWQLQKAAEYFNEAWALLDTENRTPEQDDEMEHKAHASRLLWQDIGEPVNHAIGDWQISRVYAALGRFEQSLHYAENNLRLSEQYQLGPFLLAYGHEGLARAHAVAGDKAQVKSRIDLARAISEAITDDEEKRALDADLQSVAASLGL